MTTTLIVLAVVIIAVLAAYAAWLHYRLWQQKNSKRQSRNEVVQSFEPQSQGVQRVELRKSIYLLADATLDDKMTHTEACIRICSMATHLDDHENFRREYGVLFRVAEATAHMPILDDWQALSKEDKKRYTKERQAIEQKYNEAVLEAVARIKKQFL
ncbi:MAG: DUF2489 domain-containing protein [Porticoccaceae bacterium]|nr:DUF2489 domain-containing protein [Porticoccaceae bacterium]